MGLVVLVLALLAAAAAGEVPFRATLSPSLNLPHYRRFLDWARDGGIYVPYSLEIDERDGLRGFYAREDIPEGATLASAPERMIFNPSLMKRVGWTAVCEAVNIRDTGSQLATYMLYERFASPKRPSFWQPFFDIMPPVGWAAALWKREELEAARLHLPGLHFKLVSRAADVQAEWNHFRTVFVARRPDLWNGTGADPISFEDFCWARETVRSRNFHCAALPNNASASGSNMVPLADLFNHASRPRADDPTRLDSPSTWQTVANRFQLTLLKDGATKKGDQVFISYGYKTVADFLGNYGFLPQRLPIRFVETYIRLPVPDDIAFAKEKVERLESCFGKRGFFEEITATVLPMKVYVHAQIIEEDREEVLRNETHMTQWCKFVSEVVHDSNELSLKRNVRAFARIRRAMEESLSAMPLDADDELLLRDASVSDNLRNVAQFRLWSKAVMRELMVAYDAKSLKLGKA